MFGVAFGEFRSVDHDGRRTLALTWHAASGHFAQTAHRVLASNALFRDGQAGRSTPRRVPAPDSTVPIGTAPTVSSCSTRPRCTIIDRPKRIPDSGNRFRNTLRSRAAIATARRSQPKRPSHANRNAQAEKEPTLNHRPGSLKTSMREPRNVGVNVARGVMSFCTNGPSRAHVQRFVPRRATQPLHVAWDAAPESTVPIGTAPTVSSRSTRGAPSSIGRSGYQIAAIDSETL